jgi:hypothetical protein
MPFLSGGIRGPVGPTGPVGPSGSNSLVAFDGSPLNAVLWRNRNSQVVRERISTGTDKEFTNFGALPDEFLDDAIDIEFYRDFAGEKTLNHAAGPSISFTRASNATFFNASGVLQSASSGVARFDHDPANSNASIGLFVEEQRTNSIRNNTMQGAVAGTPGTMPTNWLATSLGGGLTREIVEVGAEDGISYIDLKFSGTNTTGSNLYYDIAFDSNVIAAQGQTWTLSAYARLVSGATTGADFTITPRLILYSAPTADDSGIQNLNSITNAKLSTQRIVITHTFANATTTSTSPRLAFQVGIGGTIDFTIRLGSPQLELGAFVTSPIPTTTAGATRSTDFASITPITSFYNATESTLFHETTVYADTSTPAVFQIDDTTATNRLLVSSKVSAISLVASANVSGIVEFGRNENLGAATHKVAAAFKADNFAVSTNGASAITDNDGPMPTGLTHARFASSAAAPNNCRIARVAYWPKRLPDAMLEQLTT